MGQYLLGITATAPEHQILPELPLEALRIHVPGHVLHGIQDLHAYLDEMWDERIDAAAAVQEQNHIGTFSDVLVQPPLIGFDEPLIQVL